MTMRITVEISTTDDQAYTPRELAIIQAMQVHPSNGAAAAAAATQVTRVTEPVAEEKPKATRTRATTKAKVQEPAPAEEEADEDLLGGDAEAEAYTLDDVVSKATELINAGKQGVVKGALADFGAKRVSEVDPSDFAAFVAKLED